LKPWWKVAEPHKDILEGRFDEAVFAADLGEVFYDRGSSDYSNPQTFVNKTHLTKGLKTLAGAVLSRLSGSGRGEGIIQLMTPFGGGKTHALLLLYHLAKHKGDIGHLEPIKELLKESQLKSIPDAKVVVFVGTHVDALQGRSLWGEIAYQLGSYELIKEHDQKRVSPGKEKIRQILSQAQPLLILVDELMEYVVKASRVEKVEKDVPKGQVLAFLQELTETVKSLDKVSLVITLPSSTREIFDPSAEEVLEQLKRVSGRVEAIYTPVEGEEIYEIIRRRLFEDVGSMSHHRHVAEEYFQLYQSLGEDIPSECRDVSYKEKITKAYPFHPELIDILFERWATIEGFQRTRGVLSLLARVVGDLYKKESSWPLIQSCKVNLGNTSIKGKLIKHTSATFEGVIAHDILEKCPNMDKEMGGEYEKYGVATGLATAIFMYSFTGKKEEKGCPMNFLRLAFLKEGIPPVLIGDTIKRLEEELWYLHVEKSLYRFDLRPNLTKVILGEEQKVKSEEVEETIRSLLEETKGNELNVYIWPVSNRDIPDDKKLKLVILHPSYSKGKAQTDPFIKDLFENYALGYRINKNTIVFCILEEYDSLGKPITRHLALNNLLQKSELLHTLTEEDQKIVEKKAKETHDSLPKVILTAYRHLITGGKDGLKAWDMGIPISGEKPNISSRVKEYLMGQERLVAKILPKFLVDKGLPKGQTEIGVKTLYEGFLQYTDRPMLANEGVLIKAVQQGVKDKQFGVRSREIIYIGKEIPGLEVSDDAVIVEKTLAENLKKEAVSLVEGVSQSKQEGKVGEVKEPSVETSQKILSGEYKEVTIKAKIPWDKIASVVSGVLTPLKQEGSELNVEIEINAKSSTTIKENTLKLKVEETLKQIGAEITKKNYT
jgi:hypothetical protein